ncbi:hypothetical protein ACLOJK_039886 [Asimina triloba]
MGRQGGQSDEHVHSVDQADFHRKANHGYRNLLKKDKIRSYFMMGMVIPRSLTDLRFVYMAKCFRKTLESKVRSRQGDPIRTAVLLLSRV